jgi:hypothetical protein
LPCPTMRALRRHRPDHSIAPAFDFAEK